LLRLQRKQKINLPFGANNNERNNSNNSASEYSSQNMQLANKGFNRQSINLLQQALPVNSDNNESNVLVLGSIKTPLLVKEQEKILDFIRNGGNLLWLQDPQQDASQKSLQDALQINFIKGTLVDNNPEITHMLKLSHPAMIPVLEYKMHPITEKMKYFTLFTVATAMQASTQQSNADKSDIDHPWIHSDLLISAENSWAETSDLSSIVEFNPGEDTHGPLTLGMAQQRQIKKADRLIAQRIVVIGDTDCVNNSYIAHLSKLDFIIKSMNCVGKDERFITLIQTTAAE